VNQNRDVTCHDVIRLMTVWLRGEYVEVVVVVAGDGEVPHPPVVVSRHGAAVGDRDSAVEGLEVLALLQLARGPPLVQIKEANAASSIYRPASPQAPLSASATPSPASTKTTPPD
jgi:hypothetical protein